MCQSRTGYVACLMEGNTHGIFHKERSEGTRSNGNKSKYFLPFLFSTIFNIFLVFQYFLGVFFMFCWIE